jgi:hypothetical protein
VRLTSLARVLTTRSLNNTQHRAASSKLYTSESYPHSRARHALGGLDYRSCGFLQDWGAREREIVVSYARDWVDYALAGLVVGVLLCVDVYPRDIYHPAERYSTRGFVVARSRLVRRTHRALSLYTPE